MNDYERKQLEEFFSAIKPNLEGYEHSTFSFLAIKRGEFYELVRGRILLGVLPTVISKHFESENLRAEICRLNELNLSATQIIENLLAGTLRMACGELRFPPEQDHTHSIFLNPFYSDGTAPQTRHLQLHISGDRRSRIDLPQFDWELKAAATPFESVQELCTEFGVGSMSGDASAVEIIAFNVAAIGNESTVTGTKANLVLNLAFGLEQDKSSIGYRIIERNKVVKRGIIPGAKLSWQNVEFFQRGVAKLEVPAGAVVHCIASHGGRAQHHYWVADPTTAQNPFRAVHQAFDNNLDVLQELIAKAQSRGANARDLEIAVAWLLWMLGFSATHIGGTPKTGEAPDLIATTPQGNFIVIECTTGILKEDNKLPHVVERAEKVRQSLAASGHQHLRVLPVIMTTKTREEIKTDLDQAHKLGVLVATRETFGEIINRSLLYPDANQIYAEAENELRRVQNPSGFSVFNPMK